MVTATNTVQLVADECGLLNLVRASCGPEADPLFPDEGLEVLAYFYPAGDVDFVPWPKTKWSARSATWEQALARAVFDAVETSAIQYNHGEFTVVLPDAQTFDYLAHVR